MKLDAAFKSISVICGLCFMSLLHHYPAQCTYLAIVSSLVEDECEYWNSIDSCYLYLHYHSSTPSSSETLRSRASASRSNGPEFDTMRTVLSIFYLHTHQAKLLFKYTGSSHQGCD